MNRADAERIYEELTLRGYEVEFQFDTNGRVKAIIIKDKHVFKE
jgi:hypothetical protein